MRPLKIVVVSDFKDGKGEPLFYDAPQQLVHGIARLGHFVTRFSDRDIARLHGLGHKVLGVRAMKKQLRVLIETVQPDLVIFGHADLFKPRDFDDLRQLRKGLRLAQLNVDPPYRRAVMERFAERAPSMDVSFFTAASLAPSGDLFDPRHPIHFVPPMVEPAIDTGRAFETTNNRLPRDGSFLGSKCVDRPEQIFQLRQNLPSEFRFDVHGGCVDRPGIIGAAFVNYISETPMSPSLQPDSAQTEPRLYASTRVAQLLGNGVLCFVHRSTDLDEIFEDGIVTYDSIAELAELMERFRRDDGERRRRAERGWNLALERIRADRISKYIVSLSMGHSIDAPWSNSGGYVATVGF